jgi:5'-methylthioadenosine phosphorylase
MSAMKEVKLAFIGGTGLYQIDGLEIVDSVYIDTPFGKPSDSIVIAQLGDRKAAFLPRHGVGHRFLPTEIPVKANIWALKKIGVEKIVAVSAVGSLKEEIRPRDLVIPNQVIDRTRQRQNTFFGNGLVAHLGFADPFCKDLSGLLYTTVKALGYRVHHDETYVCMEGPIFSTRAESNMYRSWGGGVIGMTAIPESKLAREAEMCYALIALSTDYDCWKEDEEDVTIEMIIENSKANANAAQAVIKKLMETVSDEGSCACQEAAQFAILTDKNLIPEDVKKRLALFYEKYWK